MFRYQIDGALTHQNRFIAFDLPRHGRSGNAIDPVRAHTFPGFADVAQEITRRVQQDLRAISCGTCMGLGAVSYRLSPVGVRAKGRMAPENGKLCSTTCPTAARANGNWRLPMATAEESR